MDHKNVKNKVPERCLSRVHGMLFFNRKFDVNQVCWGKHLVIECSPEQITNCPRWCILERILQVDCTTPVDHKVCSLAQDLSRNVWPRSKSLHILIWICFRRFVMTMGNTSQPRTVHIMLVMYLVCIHFHTEKYHLTESYFFCEWSCQV